MGDYYPAHVTFGPIPAALVADAERGELVGLGQFAADGLEPIPSGGYIGMVSDEQASYGLADDVMTAVMNWCEAHEVAYYASDEGKYEIEGEVREYVPGRGTWAQAATADGEPYVTVSQWDKLVAEHVRYDDPSMFRRGAAALIDAVTVAVHGFGEEHPTRKAEAEIAAARKAVAS